MSRIRQKKVMQKKEQILCRTSYEVRRGLLAPIYGSIAFTSTWTHW